MLIVCNSMITNSLLLQNQKQNLTIPQNAIASNETISYYELISTTVVNTIPISQTVNKERNCTQAGIDIQDSAIGTDIAGVGQWSDHATQPPEICSVLSSFNNHFKCLQIGHSSTAGHYAILLYQTTATTELNFDVWIYTVASSDAVRYWADNDFSKTTAGFYLENTIFTCNDVGSTTNTGIVVPTGWNHYHVEWKSGQYHRLYLNGNLISSIAGYTRTGTKKLQIGIYQPDVNPANFYVDLPSFSSETNYKNFTGFYNRTELAKSIDTNFATIPLKSIKNVSISGMFNVNMSVPLYLNMVNYNASVNNTSREFNEIGTSIFRIILNESAESFFNSAMNITMYFITKNTQFDFLFILQNYNITIVYYNMITNILSVTVNNYNILSDVNEFVLYLIIFTIINIALCKLFTRNKWLHAILLLVNIAFGILALSECDEIYITVIIAIMIFNIVMSIFMIAVNVLRAKKEG